MSVTMMNYGPGTIEQIIVNGSARWTNVSFEKYCKVVVGEYIEIDGKEFFRASKKDNFYLTTIK
jgi:hypothetical protein